MSKLFDIRTAKVGDICTVTTPRFCQQARVTAIDGDTATLVPADWDDLGIVLFPDVIDELNKPPQPQPHPYFAKWFPVPWQTDLLASLNAHYGIKPPSPGEIDWRSWFQAWSADDPLAEVRSQLQDFLDEWTDQ